MPLFLKKVLTITTITTIIILTKGVDDLDIKKLRKDTGKTQGQIAVEVGVSLTAYQNWERGYSKPSIDNQKKLDKALNYNRMPFEES